MEEWGRRAVPILRKILEASIPKEISDKDRQDDMNMINVITNDDNMQYWAIAFTHKSVDPNYNYESFEILGDKVVGLHFTLLVQQAYRAQGKEADPGRITELLSDIMNSKYQEKLANEWQLTSLLLINAPTVKKTGSDVFEAFFGMLNYIGDMIGRGIGYIWTFNVLSHMLSDIDFVKHIVKQPKVYINEVFTRYGLTDVKPTIKHINNVYEASFIIPEPQSVQLGLTTKGPWKQIPLTGNTQSIAIDAAYTQLAKELRKRNITTRTDDVFKNLWNNTAIKSIYRRALSKGGFVDFRINTFKVVNGAYVQLIGIDNTGYQTIVFGKDYENITLDTNRARDLLESYLSSA